MQAGDSDAVPLPPVRTHPHSAADPQRIAGRSVSHAGTHCASLLSPNPPLHLVRSRSGDNQVIRLVVIVT